MKSLFPVLKEWRDSRRFKALAPEWRKIVFYAEDGSSYPYFEPIITHLTGSLNRKVAYVTSDNLDPILATDNPLVESFFIGSGTLRTYFFISLKADVMVMTMPELEKYHIKRSRAYPVHYVYVFHSMVSTHSVYRQRAFDHFDSVFCVGPHHKEEIRQTERVYGLKRKALYEHGYGRLDRLLASAKPDLNWAAKGKHILVAPTWGRHGLLETQAQPLVDRLLDSTNHITLRPHPDTVEKHPRLFKGLAARYGSHPRFTLETDIRSMDSYYRAHCLVSDWSGAALEYAFGLERPVLYIDTPKKCLNPEFDKIPCEPIEVSIRSGIGRILAPDRLDEINAVIDDLIDNRRRYQQKIRALREQTLFNIGKSSQVGAELIDRLAV